MKAGLFPLWLVLLVAGAYPPALAWACVLCPSQGHSLTKEIGDARMVVFGSIASAKLDADGLQGTSEFKVDALIKGDKTLVKAGTIKLTRYVPPTPGVKYLLFLDFTQGQFDAYRNIVCSSDRIVDYLRKMPALLDQNPSTSRQERLRYTFPFLRDPEPEIAADAFKEWAASSNRDVAQVAVSLQPELLRKWLLDVKTPPHCLSLFAYLLGSCGNAEDLKMLRQLAQHPPDQKMAAALDGILSGLYRRDPPAAWAEIKRIITSPQHTFSDRHGMLRLMRFIHDVAGEESRKELLLCGKLMLEQADVSDLMIEQLRQWKSWDHTRVILSLDKQVAAPITKRAILRYALTCPLAEAKQFVAMAQRENPSLVEDVKESMQFDK